MAWKICRDAAQEAWRVVTVTASSARKPETVGSSERALWTSGWIFSGGIAFIDWRAWVGVTLASAMAFTFGRFWHERYRPLIEDECPVCGLPGEHEECEDAQQVEPYSP